MKPLKDFVFGIFYLISGIYSIGFSFLLIDTTRPLSGNPAFFTVTDPLFPLEVTLFAMFGVAFISAAAYHFLRSLEEHGVGSLTLPTRA